MSKSLKALYNSSDHNRNVEQIQAKVYTLIMNLDVMDRSIYFLAPKPECFVDWKNTQRI